MIDFILTIIWIIVTMVIVIGAVYMIRDIEEWNKEQNRGDEDDKG